MDERILRFAAGQVIFSDDPLKHYQNHDQPLHPLERYEGYEDDQLRDFISNLAEDIEDLFNEITGQ